MRAVIFGYFGTLAGPGAEEYREPFVHRTGELLGGCRPRFWEALAGSFGERTIGFHGGTESPLSAVALSCGANLASAQLPSRSRITGAVMPDSASRGTTRAHLAHGRSRAQRPCISRTGRHLRHSS